MLCQHSATGKKLPLGQQVLCEALSCPRPCGNHGMSVPGSTLANPKKIWYNCRNKPGSQPARWSAARWSQPAGGAAGGGHRRQGPPPHPTRLLLQRGLCRVQGMSAGQAPAARAKASRSLARQQLLSEGGAAGADRRCHCVSGSSARTFELIGEADRRAWTRSGPGPTC